MSRFLVSAELLDHGAMRLERLDRAAPLFGGENLAIHVKDVFPGLAVDRARFELGQVGADCGKLREGGNQRAGPILDRKGEADLVGERISDGIARCGARERSG